MNSLTKVLQKDKRIILGLMSGTSLDGLDMALCEVSGSGKATRLQVRKYETFPYSEELRQKIKEVFAKSTVDLQYLTVLNVYLGEVFAEIVLQTLQKWQISPQEVDMIASHGQTIFHAPKRLHKISQMPNATLQIADIDHIATKTGILTIGDFRQKHLAIGGEGAPLALYGDYFLFSSDDESRILLNIGGISNFTFLPNNNTSNNAFKDIICSDLGAGNTLIDFFTQVYFNKNYDENGDIARSGMCHYKLLNELLKHPFLAEKMPKTTGQEGFNVPFVENTLQKLHLQVPSKKLSEADLICTLTHFTAQSIIKHIKELPNETETSAHIYVSGGGVHNTFLMDLLKENLPKFAVKNFEVLGVSPDAKEAVLFAVLANERLFGQNKAWQFGKIALA